MSITQRALVVAIVVGLVVLCGSATAMSVTDSRLLRQSLLLQSRGSYWKLPHACRNISAIQPFVPSNSTSKVFNNATRAALIEFLNVTHMTPHKVYPLNASYNDTKLIQRTYEAVHQFAPKVLSALQEETTALLAALDPISEGIAFVNDLANKITPTKRLSNATIQAAIERFKTLFPTGNSSNTSTFTALYNVTKTLAGVSSLSSSVSQGPVNITNGWNYLPSSYKHAIKHANKTLHNHTKELNRTIAAIDKLWLSLNETEKVNKAAVDRLLGFTNGIMTPFELALGINIDARAQIFNGLESFEKEVPIVPLPILQKLHVEMYRETLQSVWNEVAKTFVLSCTEMWRH